MTRLILISLLIEQLAFPQQGVQTLSKADFKFESTTQLVVVNVSVKGKDGEILDKLKASDFILTERWK